MTNIHNAMLSFEPTQMTYFRHKLETLMLDQRNVLLVFIVNIQQLLEKLPFQWTQMESLSFVLLGFELRARACAY
jgi:hypothetical protein